MASTEPTVIRYWFSQQSEAIEISCWIWTMISVFSNYGVPCITNFVHILSKLAFNNVVNAIRLCFWISCKQWLAIILRYPKTSVCIAVDGMAKWDYYWLIIHIWSHLSMLSLNIDIKNNQMKSEWAVMCHLSIEIC